MLADISGVDAVYIVCGSRCDRVKAILKEPDSIRSDLQAFDRTGTLTLAKR